MTEQTAFNIVKNHLLTQMTKSMEENEFGDTQCLYRGPNGTKCAIGALITDEEYKEITEHSHEFWAIYDLMVFQTESLRSLQGLDLTFWKNYKLSMINMRFTIGKTNLKFLLRNITYSMSNFFAA